MLPKSFKFSPFLTVSAVLLACVMLWASSWQWRRYHEKVALVESYSLQSKVAPIPFPTQNGEAGSANDVINALVHHKVSLRGEFDLQHQMIVINRSNADGPGFWLLAPFKISGTDSAVIVSRGFIPFEDDTPEKWKKYDLTGVQEIEAVAQPTVEQRFSFGPSNPETGSGLPFQIRWLFPEVSKIATQLPYPVVTSLYLQKLGSGPVNGLPEQDIRIEVPPSTHFGYTFEWIMLAFGALFFSFLLQAFPRENRRLRRQHGYETSNGTSSGGSGPGGSGPPAALILLLAFGSALLPFSSVSATTDPGRVPEQAQLDEQFGHAVDLSIKVRTSDGRQVALKDLLVNGRPTVLVPVYFHCPNLCGYLQGGLVEAINKTDLMLGSDYSVISFSIDPDEAPENAVLRQVEFTGKLNSATERAKNSWHFVTGDRENITKLIRQIGFKYTTDDKEFIHAAILVVLSPDGKVSRYLYGIRFEPADFKMSLLEASAGKIGSFVDRMLMFCFHFDETRGKYAPLQ